MIEFISQPWPWYLGGPMIAFVMMLLLWTGREFGVSSTLKTMCGMLGAGKVTDFFNYNWRDQIWNIVFILGGVVGGFIAANYLNANEAIAISQSTVNDLSALGISFDGGLIPSDLFSWRALGSIKGIIMLVLGGFLVGFGTRWAGGCTSGHAISGLSTLQLPSLIAVIGFFIGGLVMTFLVFPIIF